MLLVNGLARHAQRLGDLRPGPALSQGTLNLGVLDAIRKAPQRDDGGQRIGGIGRELHREVVHVGNVS